MCGRYVSPEEAAMERIWNLTPRKMGEQDFAQYARNFNVSPTQTVPVVMGPMKDTVRIDEAGARVLETMRWGLIPYFAKGVDGGYATFNARMEDMRTKPSYRGPWKRGQRCLILASGFFEWQAQPPDWQKTIPHYITCAGREAFAMAGLWDESVTDDGHIIRSCTIVTMRANDFMADIHNSKKVGSKRVLLDREVRRMPAILPPEAEQAWLSGTEDEAWAVLQPYPGELMHAVAVASPKAGQAPLPL